MARRRGRSHGGRGSLSEATGASPVFILCSVHPPPPRRPPCPAPLLQTRHGPHTQRAAAAAVNLCLFFADGRAGWWTEDRPVPASLPRHTTAHPTPSPLRSPVSANWRSAVACVCSRRTDQQPQPGAFLQADQGILPARAVRARAVARGSTRARNPPCGPAGSSKAACHRPLAVGRGRGWCVWSGVRVVGGGRALQRATPASAPHPTGEWRVPARG